VDGEYHVTGVCIAVYHRDSETEGKSDQ
jgi:hypothetical protein